MRDHVLTLLSDEDLAYQLPGANPTLGGLLVEMGHLQGVHTRTDRIDGDGFIASPFVQHQVYREAVYISYGKLGVYLKALERDAGASWEAWVG